MQDRRDAGQKGCRTGVIQDRCDAPRIQDRWYEGRGKQDRWDRTGRMQDRWDVGHVDAGQV